MNIKPKSKEWLDKYSNEKIIDHNAQSFIDDFKLVWNKISKLYDCDGDIAIDSCVVDKNGKLKIKFGIIKGDFDCSKSELTTLEGAPQKVDGGFWCSDNKLTSLEGAPQEVGVDFDCSYNQLTSLEGAPQKVGCDFICVRNQLTSLEGSPQEVGGNFNCRNNQLTSLEGAPQEVGGNFNCRNNPNFNLPKEKPSWIKGKIIS